MMIKFNSLDNIFYVCDLGEGSGTFLEIVQPKMLILRTSHVVAFGGDNHMTIQIIRSFDRNIQSYYETILINFKGGIKRGQQFTFRSDQIQKIKIGRTSDCQIQFDDQTLSKC